MATYGLRQSGLQWYTRLDEGLQKLGLTPLESYLCLYVQQNDDYQTIIAVCYDDSFSPTSRHRGFPFGNIAWTPSAFQLFSFCLKCRLVAI